MPDVTLAELLEEEYDPYYAFCIIDDLLMEEINDTNTEESDS